MSATSTTPTMLVTGGAGFIGSSLVRALRARGARVVTVDAMTYAANPKSLEELGDDAEHLFEHADVCDGAALARILSTHRPQAVWHLAAETHVDRSIVDPERFVATNVNGTLRLLEACRAHLETRPPAEREAFRLLTVSTDEVYGDLPADAPPADELAPLRPSSPYAASKAAADHLTLAYHRTYGLPTLVSHGSNTYGPRQFPEKLIPLMITRALAGETLPVYGRGDNVRDWLHVEDHCAALITLCEQGEPGSRTNIGADSPRRNIDVVGAICALLEARRRVPAIDPPEPTPPPYTQQIRHVEDRPGHDRRYAVDASELRGLGWAPATDFDEGLARTVDWYLENAEWLAATAGAYREWIAATVDRVD
jgi:dTDP-glucose 4,6-dehydratase